MSAPVLPIGLADATDRNKRLRALLNGPDLFIAPGCFDGVSARLVDAAGFGAAYITGSGVSMSALGAPDVAALSFGEILDRVKRICDVVSIPVIADGDTGYGGPLNVIRTVREFERAGVSAIQIEDQDWPKKCGHEPGRRLVPVADMVARLRAALEARRDPDFAVIARTDARAVEGLPAAIERAQAYREAGADVIFVESPQSEEELATVGEAFPGVPLLANMVEGGKTPILKPAQYHALGFQILPYGLHLLMRVAKVMQDSLRDLYSQAMEMDYASSAMPFEEYLDVVGLPQWHGVEERNS